VKSVVVDEILLCSQELWVVGVGQVIAVNLCLLHPETLLPETASQIRLGFGLALCVVSLTESWINSGICANPDFFPRVYWPAIQCSDAESANSFRVIFALKIRDHKEAFLFRLINVKVKRPNNDLF